MVHKNMLLKLSSNKKLNKYNHMLNHDLNCTQGTMNLISPSERDAQGYSQSSFIPQVKIKIKSNKSSIKASIKVENQEDTGELLATFGSQSPKRKEFVLNMSGSKNQHLSSL